MDPAHNLRPVESVYDALQKLTPSERHLIRYVLDDAECPEGIVCRAFKHYGQDVTEQAVAEHRRDR